MALLSIFEEGVSEMCMFRPRKAEKHENPRANLRELCNPIVSQAMSDAIKLANTFQDVLAKCTDSTLEADTHRTLVIAFAGMSWMFAIGRWTHIRDTNFRRTLMAESSWQLALATATRLCPDGSATDHAFFHTKLLFDEFGPFLQLCEDRAKELEQVGVPFDSNLITLVALESIQERLQIPDIVMNLIVTPEFLAEAGRYALAADRLAIEVMYAEEELIDR